MGTIPAASHPSEEQLQHPLPEWVLLLPLEKSLVASAGEITYQQMTSHFHLLHSCATHQQRARVGARASQVALDPLWWSESIWKLSHQLLIHQRTDLSQSGMQSLLLTNWSASTLHSRVDDFFVVWPSSPPWLESLPPLPPPPNRGKIIILFI